MLQNAYFLAKIGADTAENEQHFAEILPNGRRVADRARLDRRARRAPACAAAARRGRALGSANASGPFSVVQFFFEIYTSRMHSFFSRRRGVNFR